MNNQELIQSCTFWTLPDEERQEIIDKTPKQPTWVLDMKRLKDGLWYFDFPSLKTYGELLLGGTEKILDYYYQDLTGAIPDADSYMVTTVSTEPLEVAHAVLIKVANDAGDQGGATYKDAMNGMQGWLCGWVRVPWSEPPETIYVHLQPLK